VYPFLFSGSGSGSKVVSYSLRGVEWTPLPEDGYLAGGGNETRETIMARYRLPMPDFRNGVPHRVRFCHNQPDRGVIFIPLGHGGVLGMPHKAQILGPVVYMSYMS